VRKKKVPTNKLSKRELLPQRLQQKLFVGPPKQERISCPGGSRSMLITPLSSILPRQCIQIPSRCRSVGFVLPLHRDAWIVLASTTIPPLGGSLTCKDHASLGTKCCNGILLCAMHILVLTPNAVIDSPHCQFIGIIILAFAKVIDAPTLRPCVEFQLGQCDTRFPYCA